MRVVRRKGRIVWKEFPDRCNHYACHQAIIGIMRAEAHLLYRMMESPLVLNDYRLREDFAFEHPEFQIFYDLLEQYGNLPPEVLSRTDRS